MKNLKKITRWAKFSMPLIALTLSGCFSTPALNVNNICHLMDEEVTWYKNAKASKQKYGVPIYVQLAIIYQESHFASDARPPRDKLFGFIPWSRATSAYGFAQATDSTWELYKLKTGNNSANRDVFEDAIDFVGWYVNRSKKRLGISKNDAYNQYLAYHEGHRGFKRKTYRKKPQLIRVAKSVASNARRYQKQLRRCASQLDKNNTWSFF